VIGESLVNSPLNHGKYLHGAGEGHVTVAQKILKAPSPGNWEQYSYPTRTLYEELPPYAGVDDVFISQNRFWGPRAVSRLAWLSSLYSDLDYYKIPELAGMHPQGVAMLAFEELERVRIPRPSLAVATGRGLALVWRHDPVPRAALPRWSLCQDHIFKALEGLGADPSARDAARVLRLVGTRNSKAGTAVHAVWEDDPEGIWTFDALANEILPYTREELKELSARRWEESGEKRRAAPRGTSKAPPRSQDDVERRFTWYTLALGRLGDLQRLLRLRGIDKLPPGQRNDWMFAAGISMAQLVEPQSLEREIFQLGKDYAGWSEAETRSSMHSIIHRAHDAGAGGTVEWEGKQRDPRYLITNQKILEMLRITPDEEEEMKVLISKETKQRRDRESKRQKRRAEGVKSRQEYLAKANEKRGLAQEHHLQGMSIRKISKKLGMSRTKVSRLIADVRK
jgi:hypothetical protein